MNQWLNRINSILWASYLVFAVLRNTLLPVSEFILFALLAGIVLISGFQLFRNRSFSFKQNFSFSNSTSLHIVFAVWCLMTALWSVYPSVSLQRAIFLLLLVFALYFHKSSFRFSVQVLKWVNATLIAVLLAWYFILHPGSGWAEFPFKGFVGFFAHPNTLGAYSLFMNILILYAVSAKKEKLKLLDNSLIVLNGFFILLSYSRASQIAMALLLLGYYFFYIYPHFRRTVLISGLILLIAAGFSFNSLIEYSLKGASGNLFGNRLHLWSGSADAALHGGLIGLGYGVSDPEVKVENSGSHYSGERYIREKGNGSLALIEETGVIGFILFLASAAVMIKRSLHHSRKKGALLSIFVGSMFIHSMFEAWFVGVTSLQLMICFLLLSDAENEKTNH